MTVVGISLFGEKELERQILRVSARSRNLNPAFRSIFLRLMEINSEQMRSHGARGGTPYPALKPATIARKQRLGQDLDPLFATHALFNAMSSPEDENNEWIFNESWAVWHVVGDPSVYGPVHQFGTKDGHIPARPPFKMTELDKVEFVREMQQFLFRGTVRGFL